MASSSVEPAGIMSGLPSGYVMRTFSNMKALIADAHAVLDKLNQNQDDGNQYLLLLSPPTSIRVRLDTDKNALDGIPFRLMFDGPSALVKVIPSFVHDASTLRLVQKILYGCFSIGVPEDEIGWAGSTTYRPSNRNRGKQPDNCFVPLSRQPHGSQQSLNWPTLVIETGVSESPPRLREDARWWFEQSSGLVRTVILLSIRKVRKIIHLEKWQLADPVLGTTISPPLGQQEAAIQRPYIAQAADIMPTQVDGDIPLVLQFHALFDRRPAGTEGDILLDGPALMNISRFLD